MKTDYMALLYRICYYFDMHAFNKKHTQNFNAEYGRHRRGEIGMDEWRYTPTLISHVFWRQKEAFQLAVDAYADWVLFAVTEGGFRYRVEDSEGEAGFGDLVFCPPQTAFHREVTRPMSFHFYTFAWQRAEASSTGSGPPRPSGKMTVLDRNRLSSDYFYMQQLQGLPHAQRHALLQTLLQDMWQLCWLEAELARRTTRSAQDDPQMLEAERWLQQHAFGPVRVKELGETFGLNAVQFTRRFQAAFGRTPMDYLTGLRLQKAQTLLAETRLPLEEIAGMCGYESGFYLSRMFTRKLKLSPSHYRKMNRL